MLMFQASVSLPYRNDLAKFVQDLTHGPLGPDVVDKIKPYELVSQIWSPFASFQIFHRPTPSCYASAHRGLFKS